MNFFRKLVLPVSKDEDSRKKEFVLNALLLPTIGLSFVAFVINFVDWLNNLGSAMPVSIVFLIFCFFLSLYLLSRKGKIRLVSFLLLVTFFLSTTFMQYAYGVDLPTGILTYALIIIMSGILINARFSFWVTVIIGGTMLVVGHLQNSGTIKMDQYWRQETWKDTDTVVTTIIFAIIATISWLYNREIGKSLARARKSEAELKKERDSLEITVIERTRELRESQAEKMAQLYRFAEFGRLSSGLFHDLINPLNAVSLNMEKIKNSSQSVLAQIGQIEGQTGAVPLSKAAGYVDKAIQSAKKLENMVTAVRQQLVRHENKAVFSLNQEIEYVIEVLSHKAKKAGVEIRFSAEKDFFMLGEGVKLNQIALNLIANAIDSYSGEHKKEKRVDVRLDKNHIRTILEVSDHGAGIAQENITKIFEPFFTTKEEGLGLGLSITKRIVEKDFYGTLSVSSQVGIGTTFTMQIQNKNEPESANSNQ